MQTPMHLYLMQVTDELVKKYRMITPLLRKIEEAVIGTNTGKAQLLLPYYAHWERVIFRAVNALVHNALGALVKLLSVPGSPPAEPGAHHATRPLFKVHATCMRYTSDCTRSLNLLFEVLHCVGQSIFLHCMAAPSKQNWEPAGVTAPACARGGGAPQRE